MPLTLPRTKMTRKKLFQSVLFLLLAATSLRATTTNSWAYFGTNGTLVYQTWGNGNQIMDFSGAGYLGGGVAIPTNVPVKTNVTAIAGDNTAWIQGAINYVSGLTPNANGLRGAVLLNPGTFNVAGQINLSASGVVVWGSGSGLGGTTLIMTNASPFTLFNLAGSGSPAEGGAVSITDPYVPSGATTFHITSSSIITWGTNATIAADADVFTNGTLLYAYDWANANTTVNGVAFTGTSSANGGSNVSISGIGSNYQNYSSGSAPFSTLSAAYQSILVGGEYGGGGVTATVTLNNLTAGHIYAVQVWVGDPRGGSLAGRTENIISSNEVTVAYSVPAAAGGVGQYTIGTFTATAASQGFSLDATNSSGSTQLNALLVSDVTATGYQPVNPSTNLALSAFSVGETVMINRTVTSNWVNYLEMEPGEEIETNESWISAGSVITTDRIIKQASGNQITLDAPLTDSFDTNYLGSPAGTMSPYTWSGRISQVGLEHLHIQAPPANEAYSAVSLGNLIDSWARDITIQDGINSFTVQNSVKRVTVDTINITRTLVITGDPPADYTIAGTQILVNKCQSSGTGVWPFVTQAEGTGPIVALGFYTTEDGGISPHQRWTTGLLADNCSMPDAPSGTQGIAFRNRGGDGSGQGWAMGWDVAWNVTTPYFLVTAAPGTENWCIGGIGAETTDGDPNGIYNELGNLVTPQSLYLEQLKERLGPAAVQNIGYAVFTMSATPAAPSVMPGNNAGINLNVAGTNGFSDTVALSVAGVPAGVGAQLSTNSIAGSGPSTLTLSVSNSAAPGNYQLTINAVDGNLTNSANVNLSVANFALAVTPASQTAVAGATNLSYTVTVTTNASFSGVVSFGPASLPLGAGASFNPSSVNGAGSATLTVNAGSAPVGTNTLTIAGTNGGVVVYATANLVLVPAALVWTGTNSTNPNNWDTVADNWNNTNGVAVPYSQGDIVRFDDTAPGQTNLYLTTILTPASLTVSNSALIYNLGAGGQAGGRISGATGLTKQGTNVLILDENNGSGSYNDFSGGLTISAGTVQVGNGDRNGALGTGSVTDNGVLVFDRSDSATISSVISGSGSVAQKGAGILTLPVAETYTGATLVTNGTLVLNAGNLGNSGIYKSSGLTINNGGTVQLGTDNSLTGSTGGNAVPVTINIGGMLTGLSTADGGDGTSAHIRGLLTLNGGTLTMAGTGINTAYGTWDLDGGVATAGGTNTSTISALNVDPSESGGAVFNVPAGGTPGGIDLLVSGTLIHGSSEGDTGIIKTGTGTMTLTSTNSYTGNTLVKGGRLALTGLGNLNSSAAVGVSSATFDLSGLATIGCANAQFSLTNATLVLAVPTTPATNEATTTLSLGGTTNVINLASLPAIASFPQKYHLISYTTLKGAFNLGLGTLPAVTGGLPSGYITNENNFVDLVITGELPPASPLVWTGTSASSPNNWDVAISSNWDNTNGASTTYEQSDWVTFNDAAPGQTNICLMTILTPASLTVSNSALIYDLGAGGQGGGRISGATGLTKQGTNVLILDETNSSGSDNDFSGGLTISAGTVQVGNGDRNGAVGTGPVTDNGALVYDRSDNVTNSSVLSGSGSMAQNGTGVLTLGNNNNTFTGGATISHGTLQVGGSGGNSGLGSGNTTVNSGGILVGTGSDAFGYNAGNNPRTIIINGGTVTDLGTSSYRVTLPNLAFTGGTLTSAAGNAGATGNFSLNGLSASGPCTVTTAGTTTTAVINAAQVGVQAPTTFNIAAGAVTTGMTPGVDLLVSSALVPFGVQPIIKTGPGVLALDGTNTFGGSLTISNGTVQLGATNYDTVAITEPLGTGLVTDNATLDFASSQPVTVSNLISGTGSLVVSSGTGVLAAANTYTGSTVVNGGSLILSGGGLISGSRTISINLGGTLDASQRSDQTLTLAGGQTLTGNGTVNGAVVAGSGATLAPGGALTVMSFNASLTLNGGSMTMMEVNKSVSPSNDVAQVGGALTYGGTLVITNIGPGSFSAGDSFKLFSAASYSGAFAGMVPAVPAVNLAWNTNTLTSGVLGVVAVPPPRFGAITMSDNNLVLSGSGGVPNWTYYLLAATNLGLPLTNWTVISTNVFDASGSFNFTNPQNLAMPQSFYLLKLQ
jgi:autotransporter-associated beta strand protein